MSDDPGDRPVLNPEEFDIADDERVAEIGDDRYVVSASGDPPDTGGRDRGAGERRDQPRGGGEQPRGDERREVRSPDTDGGTAARGTDPQLPEGGGRAPGGGESPTRGGGEPGARGGGREPTARDSREPPPESPREGGAPSGRQERTGGGSPPRGRQQRDAGRAGGRQGGGSAPPRGASRGGETPADLGVGDGRAGRAGARDPPARERASGSESVPRGAPRDGLDSAAVRRHLARSLSEPDFDYGFDATLTADGETSRHRMVSDDLPTTFETLVTWFAQSVGGDTSPERALGLLLTKSDASVELPPDLIRKAAVEHGLSADDSIGDLLRAAKEEGSITME